MRLLYDLKDKFGVVYDPVKTELFGEKLVDPGQVLTVAHTSVLRELGFSAPDPPDMVLMRDGRPWKTAGEYVLRQPAECRAVAHTGFVEGQAVLLVDLRKPPRFGHQSAMGANIVIPLRAVDLRCGNLPLRDEAGELDDTAAETLERHLLPGQTFVVVLDSSKSAGYELREVKLTWCADQKDTMDA